MTEYAVPFTELGMHDVERVGGKNASLGEMISHLSRLGVSVPAGFATTAAAYREFLAHDGLAQRIEAELSRLNVEDVAQLARTGEQIRNWVLATPFAPQLERQLLAAWQQLGGDAIAVAVRSSATAEDLPDASFAGQQETFLNVRGKDDLLRTTRQVFASLFNDRAIAYRVHHGFAHAQVALSAGVQLMVRSDLGASGVMFTLDTESGFRDVVFITASYGLGETVVQGAVNPDEFYVYKPALRSGHLSIVRRGRGSKTVKMIYADDAHAGQRVQTVAVAPPDRERYCISDADVVTLARQALIIEEHYGRPMDIEWGRDGNSGQIYILQARPETVQSRSGRDLQRYSLQDRSRVIVTGRAIGSRIGAGAARVVRSAADMTRVQAGDVLVADMTDPDWEPVMKRAAAIVTNRGGRTCHAAIIARELGIPAVVGCGDATQKIPEGEVVTVSCAEGETGQVYQGRLKFERQVVKLDAMPPVPVKIMMNVGNPDRAFDFAAIPNRGVGLARLEFIINRTIGIHPRALLEFATLQPALQATIRQHIGPGTDPVDFFVDRLAEGIATIACAFAPEPVIVRLSDFKTNEYANLIGGGQYEPHEENPMLGFRGASRFIDPGFRACFELECRALLRVREQMGLVNVQIMVPFVRTLGEARAVSQLLADNGLKRAPGGLQLIMMCELPTNALLADQYLEYFDGMSIGSNDMTQLTLGLDRDSGVIAHLFDERDPAVKAMMSMAIQACRKAGKYAGICGQGPSDHPDLAQWLVEQGIESMSLNPDTVVETWLKLAANSK
ncbi:MAG TPA: phosphoenolpyruvate synthase [Steroidobacteraceae bacterium]|nr:phosphoenolpyruvate synthase [Steroidobacteraceae bacterium]